MRLPLHLLFLLSFGTLAAHCQMPCGIYNDQMVYEQVNQYHLTMFKAVKALQDNHFETVQDKNQFVRWVALKDKLSDETAILLTRYFLQQKLQPIDDNLDLLKSIHKLLFLLVAIKQNVDVKIVNQFAEEWQHFKSLFHPELECHLPAPKEKEAEHTHTH